MPNPQLPTYNLPSRAFSVFCGVLMTVATVSAFKKIFPIENEKFKGKSALYNRRKVPDGQDPWKY